MARRRPRTTPKPNGFATALVGAMLDEGIDLSDEAAVERWMRAFNDRSFDERAEILSADLDDEEFDDGPAIELPTEDEARASAATSNVLTQIRRLVDFVGDGRKLTQTGKVTLADARALVVLLGTGDRIDEAIGDRTFKTKSSDDLPRLSFVVKLATKARFVRVVKGKISSTKAGRALGKDPLDDLVKLTVGLDDAGIVSSRMSSRYVWGQLAPFFDDLFGPLALMLLDAPAGLPFDELVEWAFEAFEAEVEIDNPHWDEKFRRDFVDSEMRTACAVLELVGLAAWDGVIEDHGYGITERRGGTVTLTPAGRWVLFRHLIENHGVPLTKATPAELTDLDFGALFLAAEERRFGFNELVREIDAWVERRGDGAIDELADTARTNPDPAIRDTAMAVLGDRFGATAEAAVRGLLDAPTVRASALVWLVDQGLETADALLDPDPSIFVDVLAVVMIRRGADDMVEVLRHVGSDAAQIEMLQRLWRLTLPQTSHVLEVIGRVHPTPAVAKAARKAAMQHATHLANLRQRPAGP